MPTCENGPCGRTYKRTRAWQKYCSGTCRAAARNQGIRDRTMSPVGQVLIDAALTWHQAQGRDSAYAAAALWEACQKYHEEIANGVTP